MKIWLALISMGNGPRQQRFSAWEYGHPRSVTVELLECKVTGAPRMPKRFGVAPGVHQFEHRDMRAPVYPTGWDGNISVTVGADGTSEVVTQGDR